MGFGPVVAVILAIAWFTTGCAPKTDTAAEPPSKPRVEKSSSGAVTATFIFDPPVVRLDRDTLFTIRIAAPTNVTVRLPTVDSRVTGFTVAGVYDGQPETRDGKLQQERHVRLTPQIAPEYRIAPMAIAYRMGGVEQWFPTRPVVLNSDPVIKGEPGKSIAGGLGPIWIYPTFTTVAGYFFAAVGLVALGYGVWFLSKRIRRAVRLRRMSPKERALHELAELLAKDLVHKDQVKEFYFALTMIVRAYIERAHAIRAPEQTTEEFLIAVSRDPRFSPDVVARLKTFMQAADMVKYAAYRPEQPMVDQAVTTARNYVETDSELPLTINHQPFPHAAIR